MSEGHTKQDILNEEFIKNFFKQGVLLKELNKYKTNHILHLLLTLLTGGLWLIVWIIIADYNATKRRKIEEELDVIINPNKIEEKDKNLKKFITFFEIVIFFGVSYYFFKLLSA